ncbi:MAG: hypothetical protein RML95_03910 [Anaerolineae bacterium]|nr:hypothetical protein [Anaerolineae bacterium]
MSGTLQNPFLEDWRECLLAHYRRLVERQEHKVEVTMRQLLLNVGVPEARFADIRPALPETPPEPELHPAETAAAPESELRSAEPEPTPQSAQPEPVDDVPPPAAPKKQQPKQLAFF